MNWRGRLNVSMRRITQDYIVETKDQSGCPNCVRGKRDKQQNGPDIPKGNDHPPLQPPFPLPWPSAPWPHIHQHHITLCLRLCIILIQVRGHTGPAHPHHLQDMFGKEKPNWDNRSEDTSDSERPLDGDWEAGEAGSESGENRGGSGGGSGL